MHTALAGVASSLTPRLTLLFVLALIAACRRDPATTFHERFLVGGAQESLIRQIVGVGDRLPEGCAVREVTLDSTYFEALYHCPERSSPSTIQFRHREVAPFGAEVTERFTLVPFGAHGVSRALLSSILARVRAAESRWQWVPQGHPQGVLTRQAISLQSPVASEAVDRRAATPANARGIADAATHTATDAATDTATDTATNTTTAPVNVAMVAPTGTREAADTARAAAAATAPNAGAAPALVPERARFTAAIAAPAQRALPSRGRGALRIRPPPGFELRLIRSDGVLLFCLGLAFILAVVRRQLREAPRAASVALAVVVLGGALLRWFIALDAPMTAWSYARVIPLAQHVYEGYFGPHLSRVFGATIYLDALIHRASFALSALTPLVLFAHARYVLKDWQSALAAAALLALLPLHIRFARSDVEILQALLTSSFTFVVLYCAMTDEDARWRAACWVALPLLCVATYLARPEAIIFYPLDLGGVLIAWRAAPPRRRWAAVLLTTTAATWSVWTHLLVHYRQNVQEGLSGATLRNALGLLVDPQHNMLINPWAMPLGITALAAFGGYTLWRRGERGRTLFLLGWLLVFFLIHSYVVPYARAMQARYHLNLITPFVLLAAAATPAALAWPRAAQALLAAYVLSAPFTHLGMERDVDYFEMRELAFLRRARASIPERCTVLEYLPASAFGGRAMVHASRVSRALDRVVRGVWEADGGRHLVPLSVAPGGLRGLEAAEALSPAAREVLSAPPPCVVFYEGLTCASHRPASAVTAPVCAEVHRLAALRPLRRERVRAHIYDTVNVGPTVQDEEGRPRSVMLLREGDAVTFALYQLSPR